MEPTIGRIVHYRATNRDTEPLAAIILSVHDDTTVDLNIFRAGNLEFARNKSMAESYAKAEAGQWAWPERV